MTATLDDVTNRKKKAEPTAAEQAAEELVRRAREQGISLTGPDGLLKQLTKTVIETALNQELTEHLGHEKNGTPDPESGNIRNGTRSKTVLTEASGRVQLDVPRDRAGTFEPRIVRKRQRRLTGVDEIVLSLYARADDRGHSRAPRRDLWCGGSGVLGRGRLMSENAGRQAQVDRRQDGSVRRAGPDSPGECAVNRSITDGCSSTPGTGSSPMPMPYPASLEAAHSRFFARSRPSGPAAVTTARANAAASALTDDGRHAAM
jgi:Transposase, Mutator family